MRFIDTMVRPVSRFSAALQWSQGCFQPIKTGPINEVISLYEYTQNILRCLEGN